MLARFDADRAAFLKKVLARAVKGKTWFSLDLERVAEDTGEPRQRIVAALNYLEEHGDMELQVAGLRQGYRRSAAAAQVDAGALVQKLVARFNDREHRDVERLAKVIDFARQGDCRWRYLAGYFGEDLGKPCGHCDACLGDASGDLDSGDPAEIDDRRADAVRELLAEAHAPLATPRQMARFLAGLNSPATTRAKLTRHPMFGRLAGVRFAEILDFLEAEMEPAE
jgi:ATP-dependent DNA helicase RecQ